MCGECANPSSMCYIGAVVHVVFTYTQRLRWRMYLSHTCDARCTRGQPAGRGFQLVAKRIRHHRSVLCARSTHVFHSSTLASVFFCAPRSPVCLCFYIARARVCVMCVRVRARCQVCRPIGARGIQLAAWCIHERVDVVAQLLSAGEQA